MCGGPSCGLGLFGTTPGSQFLLRQQRDRVWLVAFERQEWKRSRSSGRRLRKRAEHRYAKLGVPGRKPD